MKILYYFPEISTPMMQWQRTHFFDELSHYGISFEVFNPLLFHCISEACEGLIKKVNEGAYDLFFTNLCNENHLSLDALLAIKKKGIPTLSFRPDNLSFPFNDRVLAPYFDLVWLASKDTKYLYDKWRVATMFAPFAANPFVYKYREGELIRRSVFIGTPYGSRSIMINALSNNRVPVDLYFGKDGAESTERKAAEIAPLCNLPSPSNKTIYLNRLRTQEGRRLIHGAIVDKLQGKRVILYNDFVKKAPSVPFETMISYYSKYSLSLAFSSTEHTDVLRKPLSRTFLRTFEIPMCGGIQFCRYCDEIASYFEDGKEIVLYKDNEEMVDKARYYISKASDEELFAMKRAARKRSEKEHTWRNRFKIAFDYLGLNHSL